MNVTDVILAFFMLTGWFALLYATVYVATIAWRHARGDEL